MDEYKEYLYMRRPQYRNLDVGDLSAQYAIRERLQCKPFKWFMKNIAFDLPKKYPPVEPPDFASGEVILSASLILHAAANFVFHFADPKQSRHDVVRGYPIQEAERAFQSRTVRERRTGEIWRAGLKLVVG